MKSLMKSLLLCLVAAPLFFSGCKTVETRVYVYSFSNEMKAGNESFQLMNYFEGKIDFNDRLTRTMDPAKLADADAEAITWFNGKIAASIDDAEVMNILTSTSHFYVLTLIRSDSDGLHEITRRTWQKTE